MKKKESKNNSLKPKTIYDEMAEYGVLGDFLKENLSDKIEQDSEFRDKMYEKILQKSKQVVPEVEIYYLEKLCESLGFFLEYNKTWMKQKQ